MNCRCLTKTASSSTRQQFIYYLRTRFLNLLALQETHAATTDIQDMFHTQFQASSNLWSKYCGLVSFSSELIFSNSFTSPCERLISTTVSRTSNLFDPITVTVVYFPASRTARFLFLSNIPQLYSSIFFTSPSRTVFLGDFNYNNCSFSSTGRPRQAPASWLTYTDNSFTDGITSPGTCSSFTFQRAASQSCIDFVLASHDLIISVQYDKCNTTYINPGWYDHFLLTSHLLLQAPLSSEQHSSATAVGKGLWRAHPKLANNGALKKTKFGLE